MKVRPATFGSVMAAIACAAAYAWMPSFSIVPVAVAQQQPRQTSSFNSGKVRAPEDPAMVAQGKTLYAVNCQACHGPDLRGGDMGGPNLLRSQVALTDQHGENIVPIIQGGRMAQGMPKIGISVEDSNAVAAYVRSVIGMIGSQGRPPGEQKVLNIVVGDAERGRAYVAAHCSSCHSVDGDLKGIASKFPEPKMLQTRWVAGGASSTYDGASGKMTAEVTTPAGPKSKAETFKGRVLYIDDFLVTLELEDGTLQSFPRNGATPKVVVHDSLQAHRDMLPLYTDQEIHDVTAYLVTLK